MHAVLHRVVCALRGPVVTQHTHTHVPRSLIEAMRLGR